MYNVLYSFSLPNKCTSTFIYQTLPTEEHSQVCLISLLHLHRHTQPGPDNKVLLNAVPVLCLLPQIWYLCSLPQIRQMLLSNCSQTDSLSQGQRSNIWVILFLHLLCVLWYKDGVDWTCQKHRYGAALSQIKSPSCTSVSNEAALTLSFCSSFWESFS